MSKEAKYQSIVDAELKVNQITVRKWRPTSSGRAGWNRDVEIPRPTDEDRLQVCFHEIGHHVLGHCTWAKSLPRFVQEFDADMYALDKMTQYKVPITDAVYRRKEWHVLSRLAMAHNRGLAHSKIPARVNEWISGRGYSTSDWAGKKVFVGVEKNWGKLKISFSAAMKLSEIEMYLNRMGLMIAKSEADDSTYGKWIVRSNGQRFGSEFDNLAAVIEHYKL